jgi:hypothetical protein
MLRPARTAVLFVLPHVAGMTDIYYSAQPLAEIGSYELLLRLASNHNLSELSNQVAKITGLNHHVFNTWPQ